MLLYITISSSKNKTKNSYLRSWAQKQLFSGVLKKRRSERCSRLTGEHPYRTAISIKLQSNFIEITLQNGCSPVNLLHIFRRSFPKNTSGRLLGYCQVFCISRSIFSCVSSFSRSMTMISRGCLVYIIH